MQTAHLLICVGLLIGSEKAAASNTASGLRKVRPFCPPYYSGFLVQEQRPAQDTDYELVYAKLADALTSTRRSIPKLLRRTSQFPALVQVGSSIP